MSKSSYLGALMAMEKPIHPTVSALVKVYAENLGIEPGRVIECILLYFAGQVAAAERYHGEVPGDMLPFQVDGKGKLVEGSALFMGSIHNYLLGQSDRKRAEGIWNEIRKERAQASHKSN